MRTIAVLSSSVLFAFSLLAQEEPFPPGEEIALSQANEWTHLVVTLKNGRKSVFGRSDIAKVEYITQRAPSATTGNAWMGRVWHVREQSVSGGKYCDATWTRAGTSNKFRGTWVCSWNERFTAEIVIQPLQGNHVIAVRPGIQTPYEGTLSADRRTISGQPTMNGKSAVIMGSKWTWTVRIE